MINISLTLSDIPKELIITGSEEKGSKKYLNVSIDKMKEADKFGNTHTAYISQTKEQREAKTPKVYIGKGKEFIFEQAAQQQAAPAPSPEENDLPF